MQQASPQKLIIVYHSVSSDEIPGVTGSFPIPMSRFMRQIMSALKAGYISKPVSFLNKKVPVGEKWLFITGDDGTIDWSRNILPWCEENKIYTHTAIITGPWLTPPVFPLAHIIQVVLACRSETLLEGLVDRIQPNLTPSRLNFIHRVYSYETFNSRRIIIGACNLVFEHDFACEMIGELTNEEHELLSLRFESAEFYKRFEYAEVGVHTKSHTALGQNFNEYLSSEIDDSKETMLQNGLEPTDFFTLPMKPKFEAEITDLIAPLKARGYQGIFFSEDAVWNQSDFVIPRVDAKSVEIYLGIEPYSFINGMVSDESIRV